MKALVADTHTIIWYLHASPKLSKAARAALDACSSLEPIFVPTICLVEMVYLAERGRIDPGYLPKLRHALSLPESRWREMPLTLEVAEAVEQIPYHEVSEFSDRIIAATALVLNLPLVTADSRIQDSRLWTIW